MSKPRILFVDDEQQVLDGYRTALRKRRKEWDMEFAASGPEALEIMTSTPATVLVSDMRMPGMDGATLLDKVAEQWPETLRIVLSGYSEEDMILRVVKTAHHFMAKPCPPDEMVAAINRVLALRESLTNEAIRALVGRVDSLPSLPRVHALLLRELDARDPSLERIGAIIERDPALSALLLKVVNSPFFGFFGEVNSPVRAVALLGTEALKGLVLSASIVNEEGDMAKRFPIRGMARHSRDVALVARCIALTETGDKSFAEKAFLAGLLHDVGKLLFMRILGQEYADIIEEAKRRGARLHDVEQDRYDVNHGELGAYLLGIWGISAQVVEAVRDHHKPVVAEKGKLNLDLCLHTADVLVQSLSGDPAGTATMEIDGAALNGAGLMDRLPVWQDQCLLGDDHGK